jgi:hypothetical protein
MSKGVTVATFTTARARRQILAFGAAISIVASLCGGAGGAWCATARAASGSVGGAAQSSSAAQSASAGEGNELEAAAHQAGETGRRVAMSLIALGFAFAAIVLAFRRDFREAVGVFAVGVVAVALAQETGVKLVQNLVATLFGS